MEYYCTHNSDKLYNLLSLIITIISQSKHFKTTILFNITKYYITQKCKIIKTNSINAISISFTNTPATSIESKNSKFKTILTAYS